MFVLVNSKFQNCFVYYCFVLAVVCVTADRETRLYCCVVPTKMRHSA